MEVDRCNDFTATSLDIGIEGGRLRVALIKRLYSQSIVGVIAAQLTAVLLAAALWNGVSHTYIIIWLACYFAVQVPRNLLIRAFHKVSPVGAAVLSWGRWFTVLTVISGFIWGLSGIILFAADSLLHQFFLAVFLAGVSSSATAVYSPVKECYLPSVVLELLPISCRYFYEGDWVHVIMGTSIVLFAAVLILTGRKMHAMAADSFRLRFEKNDLVDSLVQEKARAEQLNEHLKSEIAERNRAEAALWEAHDELENRVLTRTSDLLSANEQLRSEIAEREKIENELRESEAKYRDLAELLPQIVFEIDRKGNIRFFNRIALETFGYTAEDISKGMTALDFFVREDRERASQRIESVLRGDKMAGTEYTALRKNGEIFPVVIYSLPIMRDDKVVGLRGVGIDITELKQTHEALQQARDGFEKRVGERTAELASTNAELEIEITERKLAEEALRESEKRFRILLDSVPLGLSVMRDADGSFEYLNRRFTEIFGYTLDDVPDKRTWFMRAYPDEKYREDVERVWLADTAHIGEDYPVKSRAFTVKCKDGTSKIISFRTVALEGQRQILTYEDVTLQAETERALRESETRYRTLFESADEAIFLMRGDTFVECNRKTLEMFGFDVDQIIGQKPYHLSPPFQPDGRDSREKALEFIDRAFGGERHSFEWQHLRQDGSVLDTEVSLSRLELSGEPFLLAIVREITRRKRSEEALRQSEEKYRTIIENSEEGYYETDPAGNLAFFNDSLCRILGRTREELTGMNYRHFMPEPHATAISEAFDKVFVGETSAGILSAEIVRKDGTIRNIETSVSLIRDADGNTLGFRGIVRDVSERKRAEAELVRLEKLESIGVLAGGIAHDFNNILTAILGNISVAKMYLAADDQIAVRLAAAEKACWHAQGLTQQLLTFSRGGAPVKKVTGLQRLINDGCLFALRGSNVRCEFSLPNNLWPVEADEAQISQVINNLVINADQAMPQGGTIHCRAENVTVTAEDGVPLDAGKYVRLTVQDRGLGIPEEHLSKIFDPYFTTKQKGSGLGLTTVYSIVKNHNGLVTVQSELGAGTTFYVYLPRSAREIDAQVSAEKLVVAGEGKVLLMDDEESIRDLVSEMLALLGYEVAVARNGEEAIRLYQEVRESSKPFDAVIMDLTVPGGMGGGEAIQRLHEIDPKVRAIVSSGYSNDPIMADYKTHGFLGVVCKPYTIRELSQVLKQVIPPPG